MELVVGLDDGMNTPSKALSSSLIEFNEETKEITRDNLDYVMLWISKALYPRVDLKLMEVNEKIRCSPLDDEMNSIYEVLHLNENLLSAQLTEEVDTEEVKKEAIMLGIVHGEEEVKKDVVDIQEEM